MSPSVPKATLDSAADPAFAALLEELTNKCLAGEPVDWSAYEREHPEHAEQLRRLVPAMQAMVDLGPSSAKELVAVTDRPDAMSGTLGDFRILREIGRGGMGIVYEAEQLSLHRCVALKVLPLTGQLDPHQLQRFHNEAQAAASLHHEHIVPVFALGCERGVHYYAMQHIEGQSLDGILGRLREKSGRGQGVETRRKGRAAPPPEDSTILEIGARDDTGPRRPEPAARQAPRSYVRAIALLGVQAADALEHAHRQGVIHRDVKPGNLLIDQQGKLWLTDFGLALFPNKAALTRTGDLLGTLRYMSPEQASGRGVVVDQRSDIYSLGVTLYEMLTLRAALPGDNHQELLWQIAHHEPVRPRRLNRAIPPELETILLKAMEKFPEDRYLAAQEFAEDLQRFLDDKPIQARRPGIAKRVWKWTRRHRLAVASSVAVLMFVAGLLGANESRSAQKRAAARRETLDALREAALLQKGHKWREALVAAHRAYGLARAADLDSALVGEVGEKCADLQVVVDVQNARLKKAAGSEWTLDFSAANRLYGQAFEHFGLDVASRPEESAARIRASTVGPQLIAALDDWASARDKLSAQGGAPLWALANLADDDEWRRRLRGAIARQDGAALEELARGTRVDRQEPTAITLLAAALRHSGRGIAAERVLRQAQWRHPADFWINFELATTFFHEQTWDMAEAARFFQAALALWPDSSAACQNLGNALLHLRKPIDAERAFREVLRLEPGYVPGYTNLGVALVHQGKLAEAETVFRAAIELKPDFPPARNGLGNALRYQRRFSEAVAEYQRAIFLNPDYAEAYYNLGLVLEDQDKWPEAEAAHRKAIDLKSDYAEAHFKLGHVLRQQNRFGEALAAFERGHGLASKRRDWPFPSARWVREAQRLVELDAKLPRILAGKEKPANGLEQIELAQICSRYKRHAAGARFYAAALAAQPKPARELEAHRYAAARAAAQAGCGLGVDADKVEDLERSGFRRQALTWLHEDLAAYHQCLDKNLDKNSPDVTQRLRQWQGDAALSGVRGPDALAKLPEAERQEWQRFWTEVEETLAKAGGKVTSSTSCPRRLRLWNRSELQGRNGPRRSLSPRGTAAANSHRVGRDG
jgi:serine/threonine protein kinase/Flp pilus assembly protein TadD